MHADFELTNEGTIRPASNGNGHGGARPGAGRPGYGYVPPPETKALNESKARKEAALADMHELDFKIKSGKYLPREAFRDACATLLSSVAQSLRALPDNLERKHNLTPVQAGEVEKTINAALADLSQDLEELTSEQ